MKLLYYRFLDSFQSFIRRKTKEISLRGKWGAQWRDYSRIGRTYSRVEYNSCGFTLPASPPGGPGPFPPYTYRMRFRPGWEWTCPNCREYSIITESMMPEIIAKWAEDAQRMASLAAVKGVTYKIKPKPTAATAGCTNCKFLPGAPE